MNCKQGDLAVIVSLPGYENTPNMGRFVKVLRRSAGLESVQWNGLPMIWDAPQDGVWWIEACDGETLHTLTHPEGGVYVECGPARPMLDAAMRPIRPPARGFETVTSKPEKVAA